MDFTPTRTTLTDATDGVIASRDGTEFTRTITLDVTKFVAATHFPNGFLPSGSPLVRNAATAMYEPALAAVGSPSDGVLYKRVDIAAGATKVAGPLLWRGVLRTSLIPYSSAARCSTIRYE